MLSAALLLVLLTSAAGAAVPWLVLRDESGSWLTLHPATSPADFWLRPRPALSSARYTDKCGFKMRLDLELWDAGRGLARAKGALRAAGHCPDAPGPCRVAPFPVERLGLRDQAWRWRTAEQWRFVSGPLPPRQRFHLWRPGGPGGPNCSRVAPEPVPSAQLRALLVEMVAANEAAGPKPEPEAALTFDGADVAWAAAVLRSPLRPRASNVLDGRGMRLLARALLNGKLEARAALGERFSSGLGPALMRRMQTALVARAARAGQLPSGAHLLSPRGGGLRPLPNDTMVFVLRNLTARDRIQVAIPAASQAAGLLRMSVTVREETAPLEKTTTAAIPKRRQAAANKSQDDLTALHRRLDSLERLLGRLANSTDSARGDRNPRLGTNANASGIATRPALVRISDCSDARAASGNATGVFFLTPAARPVRCADGRLVALSRAAGNVSFDRTWADYVSGFGDARQGDYWIGLRHLERYTAKGDRCMLLRMLPWRLNVSGASLAHYADFQVGSESQSFRLTYNKFRGNVLVDGLTDMKGQPFTTRDRDNDAFVDNCARRFGGGNWYRSCYTANIFGVQKYSAAGALNVSDPRAQLTDGMCWKGIDKSQGSMCSPLVSVQMLLSSSDQGKRRVVVFTHTADPSANCLSTAKDFKIEATGLYHVTAGAGAGGPYGEAIGGRGALVKAKILLNKGTTLRAVAGCGGATAHRSGHGGNATWLFDTNGGKLLLVAGGGGGAGLRVPGGQGRATLSGGNAWWGNDNAQSLNIKEILHPSGPRGEKRPASLPAGNFMTGVLSKMIKITRQRKYNRFRRQFDNIDKQTILHENIKGGGGGGGFEGGESGIVEAAGGGGGGSFCDPRRVQICEKETGGNRHQVGYLIIEKNICF